MGSLTGSMLLATNALEVEESALDATTNNIANANTPGYTREVPVFTEATPVVEGNITYGQGVSLESIQSVRDELLQLRIYSETSQQSSSQTQLNSLQQVQNLFSSSTSGIGADITNFFNSLNSLSTDPSDPSQRQSVLTAAIDLASDFQSTSSELTSIQQNLNLSVSQGVSQVNSLTSQIAQLNAQVASMQQLNQDPGAIEDQRDQLIGQLSQLANIQVTQTEDGVTITTSDGSPLVVGGQSFNLQTSPDSNGMQQIYAGTQNITGSFTGGQLGGALNVRDQVLPGLLSSLNSLASGIATNINAAQAKGFDLNGNAGQALFNASTSGAGAAANFSVAITDGSLIAASSDGTAGSNGNIVNLLGVQNQDLASGETPLDSYSNMVFTAGNTTAQAQSAVNATQLTLNQLNDQMGSETGVSIDEETTNLIGFQHAFEAAARVITTIDELGQTVLSMGTPAAIT